MDTMQRTGLALAGVLSMPAPSFAADAAKDEHSGHHPEAATPAADRMQTLRQRMMEMRATQDSAQRMPLMDAQIKDVETMLQSRGPGQRQSGGMMGMGMRDGMGLSDHQDGMMDKRMDLMRIRQGKTALKNLEARYARGEIDQEERLKRRAGPGG